MGDLKGVVFPLDSQGNRSTQEAGKNAFAAAIRSVDAAAAERIVAERKWRFKYNKYVVEQVEVSAKSPKNAIAIAQAGLNHVHSTFRFVRDGKEMSVKEAMSLKGGFETGFIKGSKTLNKNAPLEVPYKDTVLTGDALLCQIEAWVRYGTIEADCGEAIANCVRNPGWLDLSDKYFVLLGALSAMGPLRVLLALGANIIAVDLNRAGIWSKLFEITRNSPGTMTFPISPSGSKPDSDEELAKIAGCDLLAATPEIKNWLLEVHPGKPVVVGGYAYLDSDLFVRLSIAMDAIIGELCEHRKNTSVAYLCTPTDCHLIPAPAHDAEIKAFRREAPWMSLVRVLSRGQLLKKNPTRPVQTESGSTLHYVDAIVVNQGPNYILAKRIQHWRAVVARQIHSCTVSSNVAPSTATVSVVKNRSFAWAYNGMHNFKPMEVFKQETSNAVMTALLLNDLNNPLSAANPKTPLANPLQLFAATSFHGGPWRTAHKFNTIGMPSALLYFLSVFLHYYLAAYNAVQMVGWGRVMVGLVQFLTSDSTTDLWAHVGSNVSFFQFLALLEVLHAALGITSAPAFHALLQITSRVFLVGVVNTNPSTHSQSSLLVMLCAWTLTEVVRYGYFFLKAIGFAPFPLTWLRYSLFLPLYPTGVYGELATMLGARSTLASGLATVTFATADRCTQYYSALVHLMEFIFGLDASKSALYVVLPLYCVALPFLYLHMLAQRRKVLGGGKKAGKSGSKAKKD